VAGIGAGALDAGAAETWRRDATLLLVPLSAPLSRAKATSATSAGAAPQSRNALRDRPRSCPAIHQAASVHADRRLSPGEAFEAWTQAWTAQCLRLLKPGGHFAAFGAPRTFHRLCCGFEDAGSELRDVLIWLYGTGMPKSRRLPGGQGTALKPAYEPILLTGK